jgi:glycosidase
MDIIFNHCGSEHWFIKDLPSEDWIHQWPEFTRPIYRGAIVTDPYASQSDRERLLKGWFDNHMPDLNQNNPRLATYLIQNVIWWTLYTGQDAYRIDTYFYPDPDFMALWAKRMQEEFPGIGMFAEAWEQTVPTQAFFTEDNHLKEGFNAFMPSVKDFQLYFATVDALTRPNEWMQGVVRLYYTLAQDFLYEDAKRNVLFLDNHDLGRFYSMVGEDADKLKAGLAFMLTTRGIPSMYYGTEILMKGFTDPDGKVRQDFPGGWKDDKVNKFKAPGRTEKENEVFEYIRALAHYRKANPVLHSGKLSQFVPEDGVYVYFRHNGSKTVMCILNANNEQKTVNTARFAERMKGFQSAMNVATGEKITNITQMDVPRFTNLVLELQ